MRRTIVLLALVAAVVAAALWWALAQSRAPAPATTSAHAAPANAEVPDDATPSARAAPTAVARPAPPPRAGPRPRAAQPEPPAKPPLTLRASADVDASTDQAILSPMVRPDGSRGDAPDGVQRATVMLNTANGAITITVTGPEFEKGSVQVGGESTLTTVPDEGAAMRAPTVAVEHEAFHAVEDANTVSCVARCMTSALKTAGTVRDAAGKAVGHTETSATLRVRWRADGRAYTLVLTVPRFTDGRPRRVEVRDGGADD